MRAVENKEKIKHDTLFKKKWYQRKKDIKIDTLSSLIVAYPEIPLSEITALICDEKGNFLNYNDAINLSEAKLIDVLSHNENKTKNNLTDNAAINNIIEMNNNSKKMNDICEKTKISSLASAYVHIAKQMAGQNIYGFINSTLENSPVMIEDKAPATQSKTSWLSKIKSSKFSFGFINKTHLTSFCALGATTYISGANYMATSGTSFVAETFLLYSGYKFLQSGYFATHSKEIKKEINETINRKDDIIKENDINRLVLKMQRGISLSAGYLTYLATSAVAEASLPAIVSTTAIGAGSITVLGCGLAFAQAHMISFAERPKEPEPIVKIPSIKERVMGVLGRDQKEIGS